ncbi:MAG TPA: fumarylacetoacetate hydrolase family protein [Cyclobacteriaceae bacterium]|nr:fumarylacetoacetate hydrolase family protein [Cyclobacteriaceae bacterium]
MKIYRTKKGIIVEHKNKFYRVPETDWDVFTNRTGLYDLIADELRKLDNDPALVTIVKNDLLSPIGRQEVWASGVTYMRTRQARMDDAKLGSAIYASVYEAKRPELFFKATAYRTVGPGDKIRIRKDSKWNVPEPELTLFICSEGTIEGYTVGNDVSSRDIEGENPLYLAQAKSYDASAAIGPCLYVPKDSIDPDAMIQLEILNNDENIFSGEISINRMKRKHTELVEYLMKETSFIYGVYLMTGTGIVPPDQFSLREGDEIRISIEGIGTLVNTVAV